MKPEHLEGLRACCQDDAAFERMQQILTAIESERQQTELTSLVHQVTRRYIPRPDLATYRNEYQQVLERMIVERTTDLLTTNQQLLQEITDRKLAEKALQESEQRFRSLIENATDIIVILDQQGIFRYSSPSARRLLGYSPEDVVGRSAAEFVHPEDVSVILQVLHAAIAHPGVSQPMVEYRVQHCDGSWCLFEAVATSLLDDPAIQGVVVNCHDITERKQAEEALRAANHQIANILESVTDAFISLNDEWQFTYLNQRAAQLFQRSSEGLLGRTIWAEFPGLKGSLFDQELHRAMDQQVAVTFEEFYSPLNIWFEVRVFPSAQGLSIFFLDVTERQQAQAELLEMSTALGNAVEGIARLDLQNHFVALNRAFAISLGYQQEEMIGLPWSIIFHPDDLEIVEAAHQEMLQAGKVEIEVRGVRKDASAFYMQLVMVAAHDWHDRLIGFHCFTKDITERKAAEAALRESEERLRLTLEATEMGIWNRNLYTDQVRWSESCEALFGLQPGTFGGTFDDFLRCVHPDDRAYVVQETDKAIQQQRDVSKEFRIIRPDGSVRWIAERSHAFINEMGKPIQMLGVSMDITDRKRAEEAQWQQAEREQLMGAISQRIRQSLELEEILNTTVSEVRQLLRADRVVIFRIQPNGVGLVTAESVDNGFPALLGYSLDADWFRDSQQQYYRNGRNQVMDDRSAIDPAIGCSFVLDQWQVQSLLVVPILHSNRLWGILGAHQCSTTRHWEEFEVGLLEQLATQVAIAIQQSELYQQVQQLNADLERQVQDRTAQLQQALQFEGTLKRITDSVRDSLEEETILQTAVQELAVGLEVWGCHAALYDLGQQQAIIRYESTESEQLQPAKDTIVQIEDFSEVFEQLLQSQTVQVCRLGNNPLQPSMQTACSLLACPIVDDQDVLGHLCLFKPRQAAFNLQEIRLVQQVANQCAIAIRQARLYQKAQAQVAALEELNQLKDDFLSTVSHELRTPMSNMKMAIHMLRTVTNPDRQSQYLNILQAECYREIELINDLLDLQRLEASSYPVALEELTLSDFLSHLIEPFQTRTSNRQQQLQVSMAPDLPTIVTDQTALERILAELLNNACKYTPPAAAIELSASFDAAWKNGSSPQVVFSVRNQAEIPPAELERVFDKFYRIPNADPWKQGGTGLGLALVKRLVAQLNGCIQASSLDGWTSFTLSLPVVHPVKSR